MARRLMEKADSETEVFTENIADNKGVLPKSKEKAVSMYHIDDLISAETILGASKEIISVALHKNGKTAFTVDEAKDIVTKFKNKEVK